MSIQGLWEPLIAGYANDCHPLTKDVCSLLSADSSDDHTAVISLDSFDCVHIGLNEHVYCFTTTNTIVISLNSFRTKSGQGRGRSFGMDSE